MTLCTVLREKSHDHQKKPLKIHQKTSRRNKYPQISQATARSSQLLVTTSLEMWMSRVRPRLLDSISTRCSTTSLAVQEQNITRKIPEAAWKNLEHTPTFVIIWRFPESWLYQCTSSSHSFIDHIFPLLYKTINFGHQNMDGSNP